MESVRILKMDGRSGKLAKLGLIGGACGVVPIVCGRVKGCMFGFGGITLPADVGWETV